MKKLSAFQNSIFNTAGAVFYSVCQWAITMAAVRLTGEFEDTGILQLAISVTNIFYTVACYVPRTFQISDLKGEYSSGEYVGMRLISCALSLLLCAGYVLILRYSPKLTACILGYMLFKCLEAVSDVFRAYAQISYRMDLEFVSYLIRGILSLAVFVLVFSLTGEILYAIAAMAAASFAAVLLIDLRIAARFTRIRPALRAEGLRNAAVTCFPMVAASVIDNAYAAVPRQLLERLSGAEALGYYASIATPIVFVQLCAVSVFNPLLMKFTELFENRDTKGMKRFLLRTSLALAGFCAAALAGAALVGEFMYVLLYGEGIRAYCGLMYAAVIYSAAVALCWLLSNVLIILRRQRERMIAAVLGFLLILVLSRPLLQSCGMNGVSYASLSGSALYGILNAFFAARAVSGLERESGQPG